MLREHSGTGWPLRCSLEGLQAAQHGKLSLSPCSSQFQLSREGGCLRSDGPETLVQLKEICALLLPSLLVPKQPAY